MPINLDYESFKEKVFDYDNEQEWNFKGDKPAILDFYADWCNPCKATEPVVEELDKENDDIDIYKIDTDNYPYLAGIFGVQSIPTFMFIPLDGDLRIAPGALTKESFENAIDVYLRKTKTEQEVSGESSQEEQPEGPAEKESGTNKAPEEESKLYTPENSKGKSSLVDKDGNPLN